MQKSGKHLKGTFNIFMNSLPLQRAMNTANKICKQNIHYSLSGIEKFYIIPLQRCLTNLLIRFTEVWIQTVLASLYSFTH